MNFAPKIIVPNFLPPQPIKKIETIKCNKKSNCICRSCREKKRVSMIAQFPILGEIPHIITFSCPFEEVTFGQKSTIRIALIQYYKKSEKFRALFTDSDDFISVVAGTHITEHVHRTRIAYEKHFNIRILNYNETFKPDVPSRPAIHCKWNDNETEIIRMSMIITF